MKHKNIQYLKQKENQMTVETQNQNYVDICTQNLLTIGKAIQVFHNDYGDFPEWLSELHPKYLVDTDVLRCPADTKGGKTMFSVNSDPKIPVSYGYQFHSKYREKKTEQRKVYGDAMPLVRCRHHTNQPLACLNLSFSFNVYPSSYIWESTPEEMYGTPEKAITALEAGLMRQQDNESFFYIYPMLASLYIEVKREKDVGNLINRLKSVTKPDDFRANFYFGEMLEMVKRDEEAIAVYEKLEEQNPENRNILVRLARIHEKLGSSELAAEYQKKVAALPRRCGCGC